MTDVCDARTVGGRFSTVFLTCFVGFGDSYWRVVLGTLLFWGGKYCDGLLSTVPGVSGVTVMSVTAGVMVAMAVLEKGCLNRSMFLYTFSHMPYVIFMMRIYDGLVASVYIFQSASSFQAYMDTLYLSHSLTIFL